MFSLDKFISDFLPKRPVSLFAPDIEPNKEIKVKKVCVINGAGSIGSCFIKQSCALSRNAWW